MAQAPAPRSDPGRAEHPLSSENAELRVRLQELEDTLSSIQRGDVDALVVNDDIYTLESARAATNRLRQDVLGQMEDAVFAFDHAHHVIFVNAAAERRYGVNSAEVLGRHQSDIFVEHDRVDQSDSAFAPLAPSGRRAGFRATHRLRDGSEIHVESIVSELSDAHNRPIGSLAVIRDVTDRRRDELRREALNALGDRIRDRDDAADIGYEAAATLGRTLQVSRAGYGVFDPASDTLTVLRDWTAPGIGTLTGTVNLRDHGSFVDGMKRNELVSVADVRRDPRTAGAADVLERLQCRSFVKVPVVEHGQLVAVMFVNDRVARRWSAEERAFVRDVAERTRAVTERARSAAALRESESRLRAANENLEKIVDERTRELMDAEHALRQAQKMEAVGQLTGGIAHDFNNLLAAIGASLQVLQRRLKDGRHDGIDRYIAMGQESVKRAAALTQRLLAFARRQTLDPKPTDVNRLVAGMEELLRRTAGPSVEIDVVGADDLWSTRIDPSQLESSLLNLCINARDAMLPAGGRLTIETANRQIDANAAAAHELAPGDYVSLSVTDTGAGIAPDVIKRVFDPFFTTKPLGQGTGLGLSMVYGFVRQSGGQVRVLSELGRGTTMCLFLPRHLGGAAQDDTADGPDADIAADGDGETLLIVEDEPTIRALITEVLGEAGYRTLTAEDGATALRILETPRRVDLLVTDVGLPGGMNGRQLADAARVHRPELKVLFVTGYAENAAVGDGLLAPGMEVMTKPFEIGALAHKVRQMTSG